MIRSLNTAATGMVVQQRNLDVIANNLANINTTAFKASRAEFQDLMYQTYRLAGADQGGGSAIPTSQQVGMGAKFVANASNFAVGGLQPTGDPLNVAINGNGFFPVTMGDGFVAYTRDGTFKVDSAGTLVTSDGFVVGGGITMPEGTMSVSIAASGTVSVLTADSAEPQVVGQITVATFPNPAGLERMGKNLYRPTSASGEATEVEPGTNGAGTLEQGFLEGSNVQMVDEMVRMILAQRAYEVNSKAIMTADEMLNTTNQIKR
jgi:flagellar basal-body rod protein FlgG